MNTRTCPPPHAGPLTAHDLAAMPFSEGRKALVRQEVAWMQEHHGRALMQELWDRGENCGRLECVELKHDDREFRWEVHEPCGACSTTGKLIGDDSKEYDCIACKDAWPRSLYTSYEGVPDWESFA